MNFEELIIYEAITIHILDKKNCYSSLIYSIGIKN